MQVSSLYILFLLIFISYIICLSSSEVDVLYESSMNILYRKDSSFGDIRYALTQLENYTELYHHIPSMRALVDVSLFGNFSISPDFQLAKTYLKRLIEHDPDGKSHFYLAWIEDEGLDGQARNPLKALAHLLAAASQDYPPAHMALAYKYSIGSGVSIDCHASTYHYYCVTEQLVNNTEFQMHPGRSWPRIKLSDIESDSQGIAGDDLMQYYHLIASTDIDIKNLLGQLYFFGVNGVSLDYKKAKEYFEQSADDNSPMAFGFLGMMYLYGMGIDINYPTALSYFRRGIEFNHPISWNGLGIMYLKGLGTKQDTEEAVNCFTKAADLDSIDGHYNLAQVYLAKHSSSGLKKIKAINHLQISASNGNMKAIQELGRLKYLENAETSCQETKKYFKIIAERVLGYWVHEAYQDYVDGYTVMATVKYMLASFIGFETAQYNVAYLLEQDGGKNAHLRSLSYLIRAADQGDNLSRVRAGDYYYYGYGIPIDYFMAARMYSIASDGLDSQAAFNMGYLHEHGLGVSKDFSLSKAYYERSNELDPKAWLPVSVALWKIYIKSFWESDSRANTLPIKDDNNSKDSDHAFQGQKHRQQGFSFMSWISSYRWAWIYIQRIILSLLVLLTVVHYIRNLVQAWRFGPDQIQVAADRQIQQPRIDPSIQERTNRENNEENEQGSSLSRTKISRPLSLYYSNLQDRLDSQSELRKRNISEKSETEDDPNSFKPDQEQ